MRLHAPPRSLASLWFSRLARKAPRSGAFSAQVVSCGGLRGTRLAEFCAQSLAEKILVLAPRVESYNERPSRWCWRLHSTGKSRKLATPIPRGSRPSTAGLDQTRGMKARVTVRLTWRNALLALGNLLDVRNSTDELIQSQPRVCNRAIESLYHIVTTTISTSIVG